MTRFWKRIEKIGNQDFPYRLDDTDECYYAREYVSEGGYSASEANSLISNFKKPVDRKGRPEWTYKIKAIEKFAKELDYIDFTGDILSHIPSSKSKDDSLYDDRMEQTLEKLRTYQPSVIIECPFEIDETIVAAHHGGLREVEFFYHQLSWHGFGGRSVYSVVLIDDVITSGGHFKACKRLILDHHPEANVIGVFWAKTVWP